MESDYKRVNIMLLESQTRELSARGLNVSGLIRDLLGDYLSKNTITLQVSAETRQVYDLIIANTGATDHDLEVHLKAALTEVLGQKIQDMKALHQRLTTEAGVLEDD